MPESTVFERRPTITIDSLEDGIGGSVVGGTLYEIYGAATQQTADSLIITLVSNIALSGNLSEDAEGGVVAWGDMILNFGGDTLHDSEGELFGIRFVDNNESGASELGLYQDISIKSVVVENRGPAGGLQGYLDTVSTAGKRATFGDLGPDPTPYFDLDPYLENVIDDPGTRVADVQITSWTEADLPSLGVDLDAMVPGGSDHPLQIFSLEIPTDVLPVGTFTAHVAPECDNDIIAIQSSLLPIPQLTLEKSINGQDADTVDEAVVLAPGEDVTWEYRLTNEDAIAFNGEDLALVDDQGVIPVWDPTTDVGGDGLLSPGEQWIYRGEGIAEDLAFQVDFDTDSSGDPMAAGTMIDSEYYGLGITVSTPNYAHGAMLFDTANPTGGDMDLADPGTADVPLGNVLILSEDGDSADPDDNANGGFFRFDFDGLVGISGVNVLDIDAQESIEIRAFDEAGMLVQSYGFEGASNHTLQTLEIQTGWIAAMEIELTGSGAIASLEGDRAYRNIATATLADVPGLTIADPSFYVNGV